MSGIVKRFPVTIIVVFLLLGATALRIHTTYGRYDFTFSTMAPKDTREYVGWQEFKGLFTEGQVVYVLGFRDEPLITNENLAMIARITERIERLDATQSMTRLTNVLDIRGSDEGLDVREFIEQIPATPTQLEEFGIRLTSDPLVSGHLISSDVTMAAMVGRMVEGSSDPRLRRAHFDEIEAILEEEGGGRHEFHLSGIPYLDRTLVGHILDDTATFFPLTVAVLAALLWVAFGQTRASWMPLLPVLIAAVLTLGALSSSGVPMSVLTGEGVLVTLIMVLGLSNAVHLLNRYQEDLRSFGPGERHRALNETLQHVGAACFLTSLTTGVGFLSLATTDIPTIRQFGIFGSAGIAFAYAAAMMFLPATMVLVERWRLPPSKSGPASEILDRVLRATAEKVIAHPRPIVVAGLILLVASASAITQVEIDNRFRKDLKPDDPAILSMDFLAEHLGGAIPVEILVKGSRPDAVKNPSVLEAMEVVRVGLEKLPQVSKVISPAPFIKKMNRALNEDRPEEYRLPDSAEAVAQYLLLFEMAGGDSEFDRLVTYDYSATRMTAMMKDGPPQQYKAIVARLHELADGRFPHGVEVYESGEEPLFHTITERLISSLLISLYFAMPIILIITALEFRSLSLGLISVLPNVLPLTIGMGFLGLAGISLRFSTIVAFPVAFGLAIDDTIHFLARYGSEIAAGRSVEDAVRTTLNTTGRGMVLTTVLLVGGYFVFLFSNFMAMVHMGLLLMVVMIAALAGDLLLLPALMLILRPRVPRPASHGAG